MSDIESEMLECCKCGQQVDQILSLQCDHNLCLNCASRVVQKWTSYTVYPPLVCQICSSKTSLDPSAVQLLMNPSSLCCSESFEQKSEMVETKQSQQIHQTHNITCQQHLTESCTLYCLTCESQCFCMECYLQGLHKNHEVKNIMKAFDIIRDKGIQLQTTLQSCSEHLLHEQCKITNKKQDLLDLVSQSKMQITTNFSEIYKTLKLKEQEMLQAADELVTDKLIEIEGLVAKIRYQTEKINNYSDQLIHYFGDTNVSYCVEASNFIVREKKKIISFVEQARMEKISPTIQGKFCLDTASIQQMIADMRGIKLQLISLPGLESINPTQRENYIYQKAVKGTNQQEEKENINSMSFIERSSQKKSSNNSSRDFLCKFNDTKKSLVCHQSYL